MRDKANMDELVEAVARSAGLTDAQASAAVAGMLRFLASRLPSPLFGEFQDRLNLGSCETAPVESAAPWA